MAGLGAIPNRAEAITGWSTDCFSIMDKDVFNQGDPVCVTGELDIIPPEEFFCAAAYVSVVPYGNEDPFADVTAGGANYILGCAGAGGFFDEYLWLPPLQPGVYEITMDQYPFKFSQNPPVFGPEDYRTNVAFTVSNAPIVFSVDVQAIKNGAKEGLKYAYSIADLADFLRLIDLLESGAEAVIDPTLFSKLDFLHGLLCYQPPCEHKSAEELCAIPGFIVHCGAKPILDNKALCPPTSYNSWVIDKGGDILDGISKALAKHYAGLICDPPDPNFEVVVPLNFTATFDVEMPTFAPAGATPLAEGQAALNRALATQTAAYQALLPTLEKLQGAEDAGSNLGMMLQAEKTIAYGELAQAAGEEMMEAVDVMEAEFAASGNLDVVYEVESNLPAVQDELTDAEQSYLSSYGVPDDAIAQGKMHASTVEVPAEVSRSALLEALRANNEAMAATLTTMVSEAVAVRDENAPNALRLSPLAAVSGAATAGVGQATTLTASAEYFAPNTVLTYEWDADLDGEFDDGTGTTFDFTPTAPGLTLVSVRVTDPEGRADVAYQRIKTSVTNVPPAIVSTTPVKLSPFADVNEVIPLSVEAVDGDGDDLGYTWYVDGELVATVPSIDFLMPDEEPHAVLVVVSDTNPYTTDAQSSFVIRSSKWEGQTGEGGEGGGGGSSGAGAGSTGGNDETADGSCDCQTPARTTGRNWIGLAALAAMGLLRRTKPRKSSQ